MCYTGFKSDRKRDFVKFQPVKATVRLLAAVLIAAVSLGYFCSRSVHRPQPTVEDAVLYTLDGGTLQYNVVYHAPVAENAVISGQGQRNSLDLAETLGTADLPDAVYGTDPGQRTLGKQVIADLTLNQEGVITAIHVTAVSERPVIGISWKSKEFSSDLYPKIAEILERNGALSIYLPQVKTNIEAQTILEQIDGIVMTGGPDYNPSLYNCSQTPHGSSGWSNTRDTSDLHMIQQAIIMDVPILGICRGMQGINIAQGGSMIQDVPYYLGLQAQSDHITQDRVTAVLSGSLEGWEAQLDTGYLLYDNEGIKIGKTFNKKTGVYLPDTGCAEGHLRLEIDGVIHKSGYHAITLAGSNVSKWLFPLFEQSQIGLIRSSHHQAIDPDCLGAGLTAVAWSSDGIIEAVEYQDNLFALGIQWHPEFDALGDRTEIDVSQDHCNRFFRALVQHAEIYRDME